MQLLQAFTNTCWIVSSQFSMQQHASFAELASTTTCLHCFRNYTGCLFLNASNTDWPYLCFVVGTTWHLSTLPKTSSGPLTQTLASVYARRLGSSKDQASHCWRPRLRCRRCPHLERPTSASYFRCNSQQLQETFEGLLFNPSYL